MNHQNIKFYEPPFSGIGFDSYVQSDRQGVADPVDAFVDHLFRTRRKPNAKRKQKFRGRSQGLYVPPDALIRTEDLAGSRRL